MKQNPLRFSTSSKNNIWPNKNRCWYHVLWCIKVVHIVFQQHLKSCWFKAPPSPPVQNVFYFFLFFGMCLEGRRWRRIIFHHPLKIDRSRGNSRFMYFRTQFCSVEIPLCDYFSIEWKFAANACLFLLLPLQQIVNQTKPTQAKRIKRNETEPNQMNLLNFKRFSSLSSRRNRHTNGSRLFDFNSFEAEKMLICCRSLLNAVNRYAMWKKKSRVWRYNILSCDERVCVRVRLGLSCVCLRCSLCDLASKAFKMCGRRYWIDLHVPFEPCINAIAILLSLLIPCMWLQYPVWIARAKHQECLCMCMCVFRMATPSANEMQNGRVKIETRTKIQVLSQSVREWRQR